MIQWIAIFARNRIKARIKKAIWVCTNSKCKAKMVIEADIDAHKGAWKIGKIFGDLR